MNWCLIGKVADGEPTQVVPITSDLFTIGRREAASLRIHSPNVSKLHAELVQRHMALGDSLGVSGTPSFFINGRMYEGALSLTTFQTVIDSLLATKS